MAKLNGKNIPHAEKMRLLKTQAIIHAESFYHYKLIARATGISEDSLKIWRTDDQEFSDELEQSRTRFLNRRIKQAKPEFLLERLEPEIFKQRTESDVKVELPKPIMDLNGILKDNSNSKDSQPLEEN